MKQPEVFKKIGGIIKELQEQYDYLQSNAETLNDLELELFVANTHFLKDHAEILRKLNLLKQAQQPELPLFTEKAVPVPAIEEKKSIADEPKYFEPVVQQKVVERTPFKPEIARPAPKEPVQFELIPPVKEEPTPQIDLSTNGDNYAFEREAELETIRHELIMDDAETWEEDEETLEIESEKLNEEPTNTLAPIIKPEEQVTEAEEPIPTNPEPVVENQPKTEAAPEPEPAKDEKPLSLNQRMAAQLKDKRSFAAEAAQPAEAPIADMKAAISLNDKMLFIKELFNGYPLSYSEAIEIVNRFKSFEEADRFLRTNYVTKNNWEAKTIAFEKFYALLKRRYA
ncbi:hypothetical protein [Mucilaginibacter glaciei]|uniref:Uncharacterized protein n=1 Tax=Mucilaginibacter glaciei TaxID=2772109 RepID=A0A926S1T9_9SPHI|nr:hypothetical protein [Mucilaginibacter glaciei]MBD1393162.1 hypothetical protein [Mucilaginibacter glaciei]